MDFPSQNSEACDEKLHINPNQRIMPVQCPWCANKRAPCRWWKIKAPHCIHKFVNTINCPSSIKHGRERYLKMMVIWIVLFAFSSTVGDMKSVSIFLQEGGMGSPPHGCPHQNASFLQKPVNPLLVKHSLHASPMAKCFLVSIGSWIIGLFSTCQMLFITTNYPVS